MNDREGDRQVLAALAQYGSDLSKPHHTIHYFYFPTEQAAQSVGAQLKAAGFTVDVSQAPPTSFWKRLFGPKEWVCVAENQAVPSEAAVFATTDRFNMLAQQNGGRYDGWEAGIVNS